jgi:hypothetical protein
MAVQEVSLANKADDPTVLHHGNGANTAGSEERRDL